MKYATVLTMLALFLALGAATRSEAGGPAAGDSCSRLKSPSYVGVKKCKACHFKQWKSWKKTKMAKAFDTLKPDHAVEAKAKWKLDPKKDYTKDATCVACHTTGYGKDGGYPALVDGKEFSADEAKRAKNLQGVQCEACHGPGSETAPHKKKNKEYKRADLFAKGMIAADEKNCRTCHNEKSPTITKDYKFDYKGSIKDKTKIHAHVPLKFKHD